MSHRIIWPDRYRAYGIFFVIDTGQKTVITPSIYNLVVFWIYSNMCTFSPCCTFPVVFRNTVALGAVWDTNGAVVLLGYIYAVRESIVCGDPVKLSRRLVHIRAPTTTSIITYLRTSIVSNNHSIGIFWGNPEIVMIAVRGIVSTKALTTIGRFVIAYIKNIHRVLVFSIGI